MDIFEEEIITFFHCLNKHSVKYMIVGGVAVNYHGFSRTTGDVDLWLDDSDENRKKFVSALTEREVEGCEAFLNYPLIAGYSEILLGNGVYVDLMSNLQFLKQNNFPDCYQFSDRFKLKTDVEIPILNISKLIEEKEKSSREKDKEDATQLKKLHRK